jgi:NADH-quinone oxidoreductase subunit L
MREMGGLRKSMPYTYIATSIGAFSLAGIFPLAGFWSKDEILTVVASGTITGNALISVVTLSLGLISVVLTGFYVFRLLILTFYGTFQGNSINDRHDITDRPSLHRRPHESPKVMLIPMLILAIISVATGLANSPIEMAGISQHWLSHLLGAEASGFNLGIALLSMSLVLLGAVIAILVYGTRTISNTNLGPRIRFTYRILAHGFYFDYIYEHVIVRKLLYAGVFRFLTWFDARIIDGIVDLTGWTSRNAGKAVAQIQTGNLQVYGIIILFGIIMILTTFVVGNA